MARLGLGRLPSRSNVSVFIDGGLNVKWAKELPWLFRLGVAFVALSMLGLCCAGVASAATPPSNIAMTWGDNVWSALGDPSVPAEYILTPHPVDTSTNWKSVAAVAIFANSGAVEYTLGVKTDGTLWGWGDDTYSELGDGATTDQVTPEQIGSATNWSRVVTEGDSAANVHAFALKTDGTLWGWGGNGSSVLGDGTSTHHAAPTEIGTASDWASIRDGR